MSNFTPAAQLVAVTLFGASALFSSLALLLWVVTAGGGIAP